MRHILAVCLLLGASPAAAQLPFYDGGDPGDVARAQFKAYALGEFRQVLTSLVRAANEGNVEAAVELYAENAFVQLGEEMGVGDAASAMADWFTGLDGLRVAVMYFDASGNMSYATLRVVQNASGDAAKDGEGTMVLVLRRGGREWKIQSQTLVMH